MNSKSDKKKIFVLTDNKFVFEGFRRIVAKKEILIDYFCSPSSSGLFKSEIENCIIRPVKIKDIVEDLVVKYELGFSCHSKQIFPAKLVNSIRCINIHPGFNPFNRGWYPQVFSILNQLPAGATIHLMDEDIDHGPIICQKEVSINPEDNSLDVYNRILLLEMELLEDKIDTLLSGKYDLTLPTSQGNYNSKQDFRSLCKIDLNERVTFAEAINRLRALTHPPHMNAYYYDSNNNKICVRIKLVRD